MDSDWLENLEEKEFVKLENDMVWAEEKYLEDVVKLKAGMSSLDVFEEMISTFPNVPEALSKLGKRALGIRIIGLEKAKYMSELEKTRYIRMAINAYVEQNFKKLLDFCKGR